jgi:hypothetical protein
MPLPTSAAKIPANQSLVQLLPESWDWTHDVLLIIGEGAGVLATPFVQAGLQRVITMYPPPLQVDAGRTGPMMVRTRQELTRTINLLGGERPRQFATIRTPRCSLDKQTTDGIAALLKSLIQRGGTNQIVQDELAPLWAQNSIRNMPRIAQNPMVTDIKDSFKGMPLVIVGAGPSLQKNIHLVAELQKRAIILGVNRTLTSLQNTGVWPDLAMALEAQDVGCHFNGIQAEQISALILAVTASPNLFDLPFPRLLTYSGNIEADNWMFGTDDGVQELPSGGSVSCSALSLGLLWGCDPIILLGQDLSFPGGEYYHSHGADGDTRAIHDTESNVWKLEGYSDDLASTLQERLQGSAPSFTGTQVPGYYGGTVPTSTDFAAFRTWFENTALDHAGQTRIINCTEGGAFIGGMEHLPLSDVIPTLPPLERSITQVLDTDDVVMTVQSRRPRMHGRAQTIANDLERSIQLARTCIRLIDKSKRSPSNIGALQQAEVQLKTSLKGLKVLSLMDQKEIRKASALGQAAKNMKQSLAAARSLYSVVVEQGERLRASLGDALTQFDDQ